MKKSTGVLRSRDGSDAGARPFASDRRANAGSPRSARVSRLARALTCCLAAHIAFAPFAGVALAATTKALAGPAAPAPLPPSTPARATDGATAVGAVPPPGPADTFDPQAVKQAPFALTTPPLSPEQQKLLGMRPPTTANPGTLVPGGRRQTLTFADLGALDPLQLRGTEGQNGVPFSVRNDEVVTSAMLHLVYSYSPALLPELSQLKVLVNGEVAATLPLPQAQAGVTVARDVSLDPRFITEFNHLNVQLIGHYTRRCEDPTNSALWATVSNASSLDLTYASLPTKPDLAALPQPFFDRRDVRRLELPFVFAGKPDMQTLAAAGAVASWFGSLAGYRGAIFPAQVGSVPLSGDAVVFALAGSHLDGVPLPDVPGPTIAVAPRTEPARGQLLLVLGRNGEELRAAANALALGQNTLSGTSATVSQLTTLKPRVPYDAPNWLPSNRPVRFGELTEERALSVAGYDAGPIALNLHLPPDLFMWNSQGAPLDLRYRYTVRPHPDRSSLNISVNRNFVQALQIPAVDPSRFGLSRVLGRFGAEMSSTGVGRR
ncbi:MAG: cellulose biosynthesis cyclic di-GMP-binding regulatory protein BcsB, partial [Paraburkholderia sp.]|nr:cellulose biosynthesis cyclic di-GMP-binding regulatory protein BcsB [Paraburkholderia sp.]